MALNATRQAAEGIEKEENSGGARPFVISLDGWAGTSNKTTPWNYGEPYASINRMYLKLKAEMMPYIYTNAAESSKTGLPMVRAMMLE